MCGPEPQQHVHQFEPFERYDERGHCYYVGYECQCGEYGYPVPA